MNQNSLYIIIYNKYKIITAFYYKVAYVIIGLRVGLALF